MTYDPAILTRLTIRYEPVAFLRAMRLAYRATPLGMGYGKTRFASPTDAFQVLYIGRDIQTAVAETLGRDRFAGRKRRLIPLSEAETGGITEVSAKTGEKIEVRRFARYALGD